MQPASFETSRRWVGEWDSTWTCWAQFCRWIQSLAQNSTAPLLQDPLFQSQLFCPNNQNVWHKTCLCLVLHSPTVLLCSLHVQVLSEVINPIFTYSGIHFAPPVPIWLSIHSRGGKRVFIEDQGKNFEYLAFSSLVATIQNKYYFQGWGHTPSLTFLFRLYIDFNYALILWHLE